MLKETTNHRKLVLMIVFVSALCLQGIITLPANGHGGKTHGGESFTALQAFEKATQLYDRLIASGKLTEEWETTLRSVTIDTKSSNGEREYMVRFERSQGEPNSVYFFFDQEGNYAGSNFTGK